MSRRELVPNSKSCPVCGGAEVRPFAAVAFDTPDGSRVNIQECRVCEFAWQYPLGRSPQESIEHFESSYADMGHTGSAYFDPGRKQAIADVELSFVESLNTSGRTLVDVGAGSCAFARAAARRGWSVVAVDPALESGRDSSCPTLERVKGHIGDILAGARFDVATLWDVIEHVPEPMGLLREVRQRVLPGGWVVLETGNYLSAGRVEDGPRHWMYQLDHRWYFSPDSLALLLRDAGFVDLIVADRTLRPGWTGARRYAGPRLTPALKAAIRRPWLAPEIISTHRQLLHAREWTHSGVEIFTVAARRGPE